MSRIWWGHTYGTHREPWCPVYGGDILTVHIENLGVPYGGIAQEVAGDIARILRFHICPARQKMQHLKLNEFVDGDRLSGGLNYGSHQKYTHSSINHLPNKYTSDRP